MQFAYIFFVGTCKMLYCQNWEYLHRPTPPHPPEITCFYVMGGGKGKYKLLQATENWHLVKIVHKGEKWFLKAQPDT